MHWTYSQPPRRVYFIVQTGDIPGRLLYRHSTLLRLLESVTRQPYSHPPGTLVKMAAPVTGLSIAQLMGVTRGKRSAEPARLHLATAWAALPWPQLRRTQAESMRWRRQHREILRAANLAQSTKLAFTQPKMAVIPGSCRAILSVAAATGLMDLHQFWAAKDGMKIA